MESTATASWVNKTKKTGKGFETIGKYCIFASIMILKYRIVSEKDIFDLF